MHFTQQDLIKALQTFIYGHQTPTHGMYQEQGITIPTSSTSTMSEQAAAIHGNASAAGKPLEKITIELVRSVVHGLPVITEMVTGNGSTMAPIIGNTVTYAESPGHQPDTDLEAGMEIRQLVQQVELSTGNAALAATLRLLRPLH